MANLTTQQPHTGAPGAGANGKDINDAIREMISVSRDLLSVYEAETEILKTTDGRAFLEFQDVKSEAARQYQSAISTLILRKDEVKGADPALKEELQVTQSHFSKVIQVNLEELNRMRKCTDRLGQTIRNAAIRAAQEKSTFSYGESGRLNTSAQGLRVSTGISETA